MFLVAVRFALTKQETMRVEWYYGDFSDPEAVSGSSTNRKERSQSRSFFVSQRAVENSLKIHNKFVQKCVDVSTFWRYYRDSF